MEKVMILGGRRGLGKAVSELWKHHYPESEIVVTSRQEWTSPLFKTLRGDFSKDADVESFLQKLEEWQPQRVFCFAGGGPFGPFSEKNLKDHEWALKVSLLSPLRLLYGFMKSCPQGQWIMTGSAIAESQPDKNAASYAAAKHALKGLISSIKAETPERDIRLFSPGYMDTEMLPTNAAPRLEKRMQSPEAVALEFVKWACDPKASWHRVCPPQ
jgi:short-subunit dehydrogenase